MKKNAFLYNVYLKKSWTCIKLVKNRSIDNDMLHWLVADLRVHYKEP